MRGTINSLLLRSSLLSSFHDRKHANVDDTSSKAAKVSDVEIEKAKMEWASIQFSDDEGINEDEGTNEDE